MAATVPVTFGAIHLFYLITGTTAPRWPEALAWSAWSAWIAFVAASGPVYRIHRPRSRSGHGHVGVPGSMRPYRGEPTPAPATPEHRSQEI
jgi:hypothetical protein